MRLMDVLDWAIDIGFTEYYNLPNLVLKYFPPEYEGLPSIEIYKDLQYKVVSSIEETEIEYSWSVEQVKAFFEANPKVYSCISY